MLDLAYGLLEPADAAAIRAHAASCPACTEALAKAGKMQNLFGRAARFNFPDVHFEAPNVEVAPAKKTHMTTRKSWAIAAAVVLAVGIVGVPVAHHFYDSNRVQHPEGFAGITPDNDPPRPPSVQPESPPPRIGRNLPEQAPSEWTATTDAKAATKYRLLVLGPSKPAANAVNEYSVTANDAKNAPLKVYVTVLIREASFKQSFETGGKVTLPASIWEKLPATGAKMQVIATHPSTGDKVEVAVPLR